MLEREFVKQYLSVSVKLAIHHKANDIKKRDMINKILDMPTKLMYYGLIAAIAAQIAIIDLINHILGTTGCEGVQCLGGNSKELLMKLYNCINQEVYAKQVEYAISFMLLFVIGMMTMILWSNIIKGTSLSRDKIMTNDGSEKSNVMHELLYESGLKNEFWLKLDHLCPILFPLLFICIINSMFLNYGMLGLIYEISLITAIYIRSRVEMGRRNINNDAVNLKLLMKYAKINDEDIDRFIETLSYRNVLFSMSLKGKYGDVSDMNMLKEKMNEFIEQHKGSVSRV